VIDGYPLCHPILDSNIDSLGRFALCNSASSDATANVKLEWVPAPDLPPDAVNNLSNCECFVVCTRPIKIGEELLWNYPFSHHLSPAKLTVGKGCTPAVKSAVKRPAPTQKVTLPSTRERDLIFGLDPDCLCPGDTKCKMGFCWFLGNRVALTRRRNVSN
jgi:hypothetical protein